MKLRRADLTDIEMLRRWEREPHVQSGNPGSAWDWEVVLAGTCSWREPLIAEISGRPVGYLEILDPAADPEAYWGEVPPGLRAIDIWIGEAGDLGRGFGTQMMQRALARCFANPDVDAVLVDPRADNTRAHRFYERLGFRLLEARRFDDDDCHVYRIDRDRFVQLAATETET